jgi:hypothetical protein
MPPRPAKTPEQLQALEQATEAQRCYEEARRAYRDAIRAAHRTGCSTRLIKERLGISHQRVSQIVNAKDSGMG